MSVPGQNNPPCRTRCLLARGGYILALVLTFYVLGGMPVMAADTMPDDFVKPVVKPDRIILGDYAGELRKPNGRVDIDLTIQRLKDAHINTYAFLLWHNPQYDYADFLLFLDAADKAGIDVMPYLVPPSESCQAVVPYGCDFSGWARDFATLSLQHKNLKAWSIDDFFGNFTKAYVGGFIYEAYTINPKFAFYPIVYERNFKSLSPDNFNNYIDGVIFPFFKREMVDGQYVCHTISSVPALEQDIKEFHASFFHNNGSGGSVMGVGYPANTPSTAGDYAGVTTAIGNLKNTRNFSFSLNDYQISTTRGYHFAQLLVDNTVVWEYDLADGYGALNSTSSYQFDLSGFALDSQLTLRAFDKKGVSNYAMESFFYIPFENLIETSQLKVKTRGLFSTTFNNSVGRDLSLLVMIYSSPLYNCGGSSSEYVQGVTRFALNNIKNGYVAGTVIYGLNKADVAPGSKYAVIKDLYSQYWTPGDVSGDGRVTMYDAALVLKFTVGGLLTTDQQAQADINGDTAIDAADAAVIAKKALGLN